MIYLHILGVLIKNTKSSVSNKSNRVHLGAASDWWIWFACVDVTNSTILCRN